MVGDLSSNKQKLVDADNDQQEIQKQPLIALIENITIKSVRNTKRLQVLKNNLYYEIQKVRFSNMDIISMVFLHFPLLAGELIYR